MNSLHQLELAKSSLQDLLKMIDVDLFKIRLEELNHLLSKNGLWDDNNLAASLFKEHKSKTDIINIIVSAQETINFYSELSSLGEDISKEQPLLEELNKQLSTIIFKHMMSDPIDNTPAILSISAGAGGLEAANWVTMLLRMYLRYADTQGFSVEILDEKPSEEHSSICTDSVSVRIDGSYAYGFLKGESGVHRLIRNSPFNAANARQTSFAAVHISPDIEDAIDIKIDEKDIDIVAQTSGAKGGQNANRVCSAIRLRHFPTGINIFVRTERDQLANKKTALKMLKAKLYDIELKKQKMRQDDIINSQSDVSFGHQIRSYTETPQAIVRDHRTGCQNNDFNNVLDGNIHNFLIAYLKMGR